MLYKDKYGNTKLHIECRKHTLTDKQVSKYKKYINKTNFFGKTPIFYADYHTTKLLVEHGANYNAKTILGKTPITSAIEKHDAEKVEFLLQQSYSNINHKSIDGSSYLHYACYHHDNKIIELLLRYGINTNIKDNYGKTAHERLNL
jgi:ankyrin repeat protein